MTDNEAGRDERAKWIREALERYEGPLVRYAAHITGDLETARDAVQDTFLRLCRVERSHVEGRLAAWLYTVCRNRSLDIRRKESQMEALKHVGAGGSDDPLPAHVAERRESHDDVVRVLATLPPRQQEVVRLKFQDGLSYKEISAVTGLSTSNVGYTIHVAVKAMREQMLSGTGALLEGHRSAP